MSHTQSTQGDPTNNHDTQRPPPRALRLGVAGPVGTGKSSLIATVCRGLADAAATRAPRGAVATRRAHRGGRRRHPDLAA